MVHAARGEIGIGGDSLQMPRFRAAYDQLLPEIEGMEKRELLVVNLDIPTIVTLVLGKISKMRTLRDACAGLPGFDLAHFDRIEPLALAMGYTHGLHAAASVPRLSVPELSARAVEMRQALVKDCEALAQRGLLDGRQLKELKGPVGYKNQAFDLLTLVALMRDRWTSIDGKSAVNLVELDQAESLADQLLTAVGEREQLPEVTAAAAEVRRRAFTLFIRAYEELRRAAEYLRWHTGDVDEYVPSLYAGKKKREPAQKTKSLEAPAASVPEHGEKVAVDSTRVAVGMPGSDPFTAADSASPQV